MTVAELIAQLQQLPQESIVVLEGCDCVGDAVRATLCPFDPEFQVMIRTPGGAFSQEFPLD